MIGLRTDTQKRPESKEEKSGINKNIRVVLLAEHELIRYGLRRMLEKEEDMEIVAEYVSTEELLANITRLRPDIVLISSQMPVMNGIGIIYSLKGKELNYAGDVIVLADSPDYRDKALNAGASRYLLRDITRTELARAVRDVYLTRQIPRESAGSVEEIAELMVSPPFNAAQLMRVMWKLEKRLGDSRVSIMHTLGSWNEGAIVIMSLKSVSTSHLLEMLENMPEVKTTEQVPQASSILRNLRQKPIAAWHPNINPTTRIHMVLN